jgi:hypothetical protein
MKNKQVIIGLVIVGMAFVSLAFSLATDTPWLTVAAFLLFIAGRGVANSEERE